MSKDMEYDSLRKESLDLMNRKFNLTTFCLTATVAFISFSFAAHNSLVFLAPLIILSFTLNEQVNIRLSVRRIGIYLRLFHEDESDDLNWETSLSKLRKTIRITKKTSLLFNIWNYESTIIITGICCILLSLLLSVQWYELIATVAAACWWTYLSIRARRNYEFYSLGKFEEGLVDILTQQKTEQKIELNEKIIIK